MRYIESKTVKITDPKTGKELDFSYKDAVVGVCSSKLPNEEGFNIGLQRRLLKIIDAFETNENTVPLEDSDWEILNYRASAFPWPFPSKVFVEFVQAVNDARTEE